MQTLIPIPKWLPNQRFTADAGKATMRARFAPRIAFVALGCALAAAVAISLSEERESGPSREKRPAGEGDADQAGRLRPARDAAA
jgi:hypothetical protein